MKIKSQVKPVIIRHFIIIRTIIEFLIAYQLSGNCSPVTSMIMPTCIHLEPITEFSRCRKGQLMPVVVSGRIPIMVYSFKITLCPRQGLSSESSIWPQPQFHMTFQRPAATVFPNHLNLERIHPDRNTHICLSSVSNNPPH